MDMAKDESRYSLGLAGAFRLTGPGGRRIEISSKRGQAMLAMLAVAGGGERTRSWLQDRLWGSRGQEQAQASLRRELSNLKKLVNQDSAEILDSDYSRIWIDLRYIDVDVRAMTAATGGEFLEGLDISGEEMFEDWLREERMRLEQRAQIPVHPTEPESSIPSAAISPEFSKRPAIAVLAFHCTPATAEKEAIAQGISEDVIDRLSKLRWLPVIARSSSFALAPEQYAPPLAGAALGARYIVDGTIRDSILSVSLSDAESGETLWNGRCELPAEGDNQALDTILAGITATLGIQVDQREQQRAMEKAKADLTVRELIWRGRWHLNRFTREDAIAARDCFEEATRRAPNSAEALIQQSWLQLWDLWATRGNEAEIRDVRKKAQMAIIADYDDARGHMLAGIAEIWLRQPLRAEALLRRAIDINPSLVMAHAQLGSALHLKGDHRGAIEALRTAIRLSPNDQDLFFMKGELAMALLFESQLEEALVEADEAIARRGAYWVAHVAKIIALFKLGRSDAAREAFADLQASKTGFRDAYIDWLPFVDSMKRDFLKDGLNLAHSGHD